MEQHYRSVYLRSQVTFNFCVSFHLSEHKLHSIYHMLLPKAKLEFLPQLLDPAVLFSHHKPSFRMEKNWTHGMMEKHLNIAVPKNI